MGVRVVFLGRLRELAAAEVTTLPAPLTWPALIGAFSPSLREALQDDRVRVTCDGELIPDKTLLNAGDGGEVALLPPVSGG